MWKEAVMSLILRYYPRIRLEGLGKTAKPLQDSRTPGPDLKPEPPEYEAGVLITRPQHTVTSLKRLTSICNCDEVL
jgi:hypothetical protein